MYINEYKYYNSMAMPIVTSNMKLMADTGFIEERNV